MTVNDVLDRLQLINQQLADAASSPGQDSNSQIVSLRNEFTGECGNLLKTICDDPRIFQNRPLFEELQAGLEQMRSRLAGHQLKWQISTIEANRAAYKKSSASTFDQINLFVTTAREKIDALED